MNWRERLWVLMDTNEGGSGEGETPPETPPEPEAKKAPLGLRLHADKIEADLKAEREQRQSLEQVLVGYRRRDAFTEASTKAGVSDVTIEELGDLPPDQITPDLVRAKSDSKARARLEAMEDQAKTLGFESAEAMEEALKEFRERKEREATSMAANAAVAKGSAGAPPPQKSPTEEMFSTFAAERKQGRAQDKARGAAVTRLIARAVEDSAKPAGRPT